MSTKTVASTAFGGATCRAQTRPAAKRLLRVASAAVEPCADAPGGKTIFGRDWHLPFTFSKLKLPFVPLDRHVEVTVPPADAGAVLLDYLALRYNYLDRTQWSEQLALGKLRVNGTVADGTEPLSGGDAVFFDAAGLYEQEVSWEISVLEETSEYILVNKPGNLPCHPAGRFFNHTLWAWLRQAHGLENIHFVNRLDRETSGIVLVGKTPRFAAAAAKLLHSLGIESHKRYAVLVHGRFPAQLSAHGWLMKDLASPVAKKKRFVPVGDCGDTDVVELPEDDEAVTAQTDFRLRGFYRPPRAGEDPRKFVADEAGAFSLLEATLHTGRTHQIRATLCSLGYPVVGDKLYGVDDRIFLKFATSTLAPADWARLILPTQALHAEALSLPRLGIDATAPIPFI